ncbi:MAG: hypothetical protein CVV22_04270 [Ignavibacteriae bacterium HGW-Ignavibacteriae-1]|jgi:hypothetical protein|nr:MAG: hypothetical protein CVV22_04270 [Ignavibacteriae bacterium HGW-Ignavibacteriae-1]
MKKFILLFAFILANLLGSVQNIFSSPIVDYEIKQVADFQISDGAKSFDGITFKDSVNGVALIRNQDYEFYIFRTSNAGDSWEFISEIDIYDRWVMKGIAPPAVTGISCYGDFICITTQPYLALFGPQPPADTGVYMMSYDFGETWEVNNFPEKLLLNYPQFDESGNLYILGTNWDFRKKTSTRKGIFKFSKTNNSWEEIPLPTIQDSSYIYNLRIYNDKEYNFNVNLYQKVQEDSLISIIYNYHTLNSGITWNSFEIPFKNISIKHTSKNVAWIPLFEITEVNDSTIKQDLFLINTKDGWISWNKINIGSFITKSDAERIYLASFIYYDDDNIWLNYSGGRQYITNNGGKDWIEFPKFESSIMQLTPNAGYY